VLFCHRYESQFVSICERIPGLSRPSGAPRGPHLAALAGADPVVVPRRLVLAHEAGLVDPGGRRRRRGAGHDLLRAGALGLYRCGPRERRRRRRRGRERERRRGRREEGEGEEEEEEKEKRLIWALWVTLVVSGDQSINR